MNYSLYRFVNIRTLLVMLCLFFICESSYAQNKENKATNASQADLVFKQQKEWKIKNSLFFLPNEIVAIVAARNGVIKSKDTYSDNPENLGPRYIALAGIAYVSKNDWTIWINDEKITPDNIPERIVDLDVHKDYINIKWHDVAYQRVMVFTLKPHQRFHLDTGMLLPG